MKSFSFSPVVSIPQHLSFIFILIALSWTIVSCEKEFVQTAQVSESVYEENFFDFDYLSDNNSNIVSNEIQNAQSTVLEVIGELKKVENKVPFVKEYIEKFGYPAWDKSEVSDDGETLTVLTPLAFTADSNVTGTLFAKFQNGKWSFLHLDNSQGKFRFTQSFFTAKLFSPESLSDNLIGIELEKIRSVNSLSGSAVNTRSNCQTYWIEYAFCIEVSMVGVGSAGVSCETLVESITVCNFDSPSISPADPGSSGGGGGSNDNTVPWDRICERSFDYKTVGESYTASLKDVSQKYVHLPMNILDSDFVGFKTDMCVSVPRRDRFGQFMSIEYAKELTVRAYERARGQVMDGIVRDIINTPTDASRKFKEYFNQKLKDEYYWNPWAIRANLSRCRGLTARTPTYGC